MYGFEGGFHVDCFGGNLDHGYEANTKTATIRSEAENWRPCGPESYSLVIGAAESLASMLLDELTPAGVVSLYFWLEQARCGGPPSLLGCHELRVVEPLRWVQRLQEWSLSSGEPDGREHATPTSDAAALQLRRKYPGSYVMDLLSYMGLMPTMRCDFWSGVVEGLPAELGASCRRLGVRGWEKAW